MKISSFRDFTGKDLEQIGQYLRSELSSNFKDIVNVFKNLTFGDNFESFEVTVTINATSELAIENKLRKSIPSKRLIVRSNGSALVDGDTAWTQTHVYMKNTSASAITATIIFLK